MPATPANALNISSTGLVKFDGTATFSATTVTQHDVLVGGTSNAITSVAPSATSGVPLISQGAAADPTFGTAVVAGGGTGATSFNINGPVISNTTTTGALAAITLTNQKFLVGNTSAAPTAKTLSVVRQVFTGSGTYTPTSGMIYCDIEVLGGGGGGGGAATTAGNNSAAASGGGAGGYARKIVSSATIGVSQSVTVGTKGTGGSAGNNNGNDGNTSSVGAIVSATGGIHGLGAASGNINALGGAGGVGSSGDFNTNGAPGGNSTSVGLAGWVAGWGGTGGSSLYGGGGKGANVGNGTGGAATNYGSGGGGAATAASGQNAGGDGSDGIVIITEYVIS